MREPSPSKHEATTSKAARQLPRRNRTKRGGQASSLLSPALLLLCSGCGSEPLPKSPHIPLTPPAELCADPGLGPESLCLPSVRIERLLRTARFRVRQIKGTSTGISGAKVLVLDLPDDALTIKVKWKQSKRGGDGMNNTPRMEIAAYEIQKLFLEPDEYVVPPTVGRCLPPASFSEQLGAEDWTFEGDACLYGVLSYWIEGATDEKIFDPERYACNPSYRASLGRMNLLTYLIDHRDTRPSNFILSKDPASPRAFSIDNGLAFSGLANPRQLFLLEWNQIIVPSLPRRQIERLRRVTRADLDTLAVIAQYQISPGALVEVAKTAPFAPEEGVRRSGDLLQLGLMTEEIDDIEDRLVDLLAEIDSGRLQVY